VSATGIAATARGWRESAFAQTANTIVRIVARPATSAWLNPNPMPNEPLRVVFHLNRDSRLVGVLCSAVQFQASQAGLGTEAVEQLAKAAEDVCQETISRLARGDESIEVALETYSDRVEVAVYSRGEAMPAAGLETFAFSSGTPERPSGIDGLQLLSRVDRIVYNNENGVGRTTLVKFLRKKR
jgi:hypothetical protein